MDRPIERAVGLALSVYLYRGKQVSATMVFSWADKFATYIREGHWPSEALHDHGYEE